MLIERVELRVIRLPLVSPFVTSFGRQDERTILLARVWADGVVGWGECGAMVQPWYLSETIGTCQHILRDFIIPAMLGRRLEHPADYQSLVAWIRGHTMAKAVLEEALWDIYARQRGESLATTLGGVRARIESGVSIGIQADILTLLRAIEGFCAQGYRRIKVKIKPGWDVDVVREIRRSFPSIPLMVDANSAYTLADVSTLQALDAFHLMMIEQPLGSDDIIDHASLQKRLRTAICLDESILSVEDARKAISLGACRIVNIKRSRVGGLFQAKRLHDYCYEQNVPVWCGGMLESGIGRAFNVALASLPNFVLPGDVSASDRYYTQDIITEPFELSPDGTIAVPQGEGIGVEVDYPRLEAVTLSRETFPS
jgi:O-succinylbenzoate synthase